MVVHFPAAIKVVRLGCMKKAFLGSSKHSSYNQVAQAVFMLGGGVPKKCKTKNPLLIWSAPQPPTMTWKHSILYELYLTDTGF